jgi:glycerophosphoryl diester phosphodiesterase
MCALGRFIRPSATPRGKFVEDAHRRGWKVFPYTANTPTQIAHIKATGADGVFTDYPERVAQSGG